MGLNLPTLKKHRARQIQHFPQERDAALQQYIALTGAHRSGERSLSTAHAQSMLAYPVPAKVP
jgi:hypothetical protein